MRAGATWPSSRSDGMTALDIKLFRDVRRLWAQVLAVALVVGAGVATLVLAVGSHRWRRPGSRTTNATASATCSRK
ncbi:hypothetical protein [Bradyrhizobium sp.]|uniref:hypothetical protein n=1 Tax=Bradyrhizobium sp. TaxID=376 RepID=UPI0025C162DC|nr:hypothetical protein [Bradyrhizobium sp.]